MYGAYFCTAHVKVQLQYRVSLTKRQTATGTTHDVRGYRLERELLAEVLWYDRTGTHVHDQSARASLLRCMLIGYLISRVRAISIRVLGLGTRLWHNYNLQGNPQVCLLMSVILWDLMGYQSTTFCKGL